MTGFDTLRVALLFGWLRFALDIREGGRLRSFIERWVRPAPRATRRAKKRPNIYAWCYADEELRVAMGSSGSVTVWEAVPKQATAGATETETTPKPGAQPRAPLPALLFVRMKWRPRTAPARRGAAGGTR